MFMFSPRQKMVVATSPQPNELEQKKKRQTLERAKANHLSKQLQTRLQYAKLKVEHGWQRQNLNEVENLYFHHSHLRCARQSHGTIAVPQRVVVANPGSDIHTIAPSSTPSGDQPVAPSPSLSTNGLGSTSPPPEHVVGIDGQPSSSLQTPVPDVFGSSVTTTLAGRPQSTVDLSDPHILARLAQLQTQIQIPSQCQATPWQPSMTIPPVPMSQSLPVSVPPGVTPTAFLSSIQSPLLMNHPHHTIGISFPAYAPQPFIGTPTSGSVPLFPIPVTATSASIPLSPAIGASQSLVPTTTSSTTPIPTTQTPIAPTALTYDSFWSTHASSTGPTRALYRTNTGFTASATPAGNVAMLTPGGHAAVMTADGVYVGGATSRNG